MTSHDSRTDPRAQLVGEYLRQTFAICDAHQVPRDSALAAAIYRTVERLDDGSPELPERVVRVPPALGDPEARRAMAARIEEAAAAGARRIVLDFADAAHVDSSGLSAVVSAVKKARAAGAAVTLVNVGEELRTVIDLTGLAAVMSGEGG
ncbi:MAG TPA: STAS domain-containing protein [Gemmatimonadaceae bacterium]|nr:STAS domain-containing protein [Gemmatimonadaceae bacterium]